MIRTFHLRRFVRKMLQGAVEMRWQWTLLLTFAQALITYLGLAALGETDLVSSPIQFFYYLVVTASSVGYGDFSPVTDAGKLFSAAWVIPSSMFIFGLLIGKIINAVTVTMRKIMNGFGNFSDKTGHLVVIGHVQGQTEKLLDETCRLHGKRDVVILCTQDIAGSQDGWAFIRATSLSNVADLERAGIKGADFIVILGRDDDESLAASLAVSAQNPKGHTVAYFRNDSGAALIRSKCDNIKVHTSNSIEQVARALSDPGAGEVLHNLASTRVGATLHSLTFRGQNKIRAGELGAWLRKQHRATFMGYLDKAGSAPVMDFGEDDHIQEGQTIFYVAGARLPESLTYPGMHKAA